MQNLNKIFKSLWNSGWTKGILIRKVIKTPTAKIILGYTSDTYYNFALPTVKLPEKLGLKTIRKHLDPVNKKAGFYLLEEHQKAGFVEYLVRNGYEINSRESWMVYDRDAKARKTPKVKIQEVTPKTFSDFYSVLSVVFKHFPGNEKYLKICRKTLTGEMKSRIASDLKSDFYLIYENKKPVAGGGLFYSKKENIAYLHNAGTLKKYRGKGYQTALIKHRVAKAKRKGINRIYTLVEHGEQSWKNTIKCGFRQIHLANIVVLS